MTQLTLIDVPPGPPVLPGSEARARDIVQGGLVSPDDVYDELYDDIDGKADALMDVWPFASRDELTRYAHAAMLAYAHVHIEGFDEFARDRLGDEHQGPPQWHPETAAEHFAAVARDAAWACEHASTVVDDGDVVSVHRTRLSPDGDFPYVTTRVTAKVRRSGDEYEVAVTRVRRTHCNHDDEMDGTETAVSESVETYETFADARGAALAAASANAV